MGLLKLFHFAKEDEPVIVKTKQGRVEGRKRKDTGVCVFRGIPFAAPPTGSRRFRKPEPYPAWEGVKLCEDFGKTAVQGLSIIVLAFLPKFLAALAWGCLWLTNSNPIYNLNPKRPMALPRSCSEEECLNLTLETPFLPLEGELREDHEDDGSEGRETRLLPVMVWIHGGAFQLGANSQFVYQPPESFLARKGVVVVTINYRLGILGFLKVEGGDYNCGMWDQVAALQWVQENIAAFGGDPGNVTIFGESAGGMSCGFLSATDFAGRLFHRVILQSGSIQTGLSREEAGWLAEEGARALDISKCSLETMGDIPAPTLLAAQNLVIRGKKCGIMPFQPVVDGDLLKDRIIDKWRAGVARNLDFLISYTRHEELLFLKLFPANYTSETEQKLQKRVTFSLSPPVMDVPDFQAAAQKVVAEIKAWEGGGTPPSHADYWTYKAVDFNSVLKFAIPSHIAAETLTEAPGRAKKVYLCRFDMHSPTMNGACHAIDLAYVFGSVKPMSGGLCPADIPSNASLSAAVISAWTNFARTGDPNFQSGEEKKYLDIADAGSESTVLPDWPHLTANAPHQVMILDVPLSACRIQEVDLHLTFPELWKIVLKNGRALWFHRPPPSGSKTERAMQSNL